MITPLEFTYKGPMIARRRGYQNPSEGGWLVWWPHSTVVLPSEKYDDMERLNIRWRWIALSENRNG